MIRSLVMIRLPAEMGRRDGPRPVMVKVIRGKPPVQGGRGTLRSTPVGYLAPG